MIIMIILIIIINNIINNITEEKSYLTVNGLDPKVSDFYTFSLSAILRLANFFSCNILRLMLNGP